MPRPVIIDLVLVVRCHTFKWPYLSEPWHLEFSQLEKHGNKVEQVIAFSTKLRSIAFSHEPTVVDFVRWVWAADVHVGMTIKCNDLANTSIYCRLLSPVINIARNEPITSVIMKLSVVYRHETSTTLAKSHSLTHHCPTCGPCFEKNMTSFLLFESTCSCLSEKLNVEWIHPSRPQNWWSQVTYTLKTKVKSIAEDKEQWEFMWTAENWKSP